MCYNVHVFLFYLITLKVIWLLYKLKVDIIQVKDWHKLKYTVKFDSNKEIAALVQKGIRLQISKLTGYKIANFVTLE